MGENGSFPSGHASAWAFHSLRLVGYSVPKVSKYGAEHLKQKIEESGLTALPRGRLALYILGLVSLCEDPRNFNKQNLVAVLNKDISNYRSNSYGNHLYQLALAHLALCISGERTNKENIDLLTYLLQQSTDSIDALSLGTIALDCVRREAGASAKEPLTKIIKSTANKILRLQKKKKGNLGNEVTISLAVQVSRKP